MLSIPAPCVPRLRVVSWIPRIRTLRRSRTVRRGSCRCSRSMGGRGRPPRRAPALRPFNAAPPGCPRCGDLAPVDVPEEVIK